MKKYRKTIQGVVSLFVIAFIMTAGINVSAATKKELCENNATVVKKYNASMKPTTGTNLYTISMNPEVKDYKNITFTIVKINDTEIKNGATVKSGSKNDKIDLDDYFYYNSNNENVVSVTLYAPKDADCNGGVYLTLDLTKQGKDYNTQGKGPEIADGIIVSNNPINCSSPKDEFETKFCEVKTHAIAANNTFDLKNSGKFDSSKVQALKCSSDATKQSSDGYPNKSYYYAENTVTISSDEKYEYHFSPTETETSGVISCKLKCEESVIVEYGPPVASKAGLCFEYKVKVTSRVNCTLAEKPQKPETYSGYCSPTPWCTSVHGKSYRVNQGGPSEDYDQCVNECDGGKYTTKCSNSCYKKVYGNSSNATKTTNTLDIDYASKLALGDKNVANDLDTCVANSSYGCYYRQGSGIYFKKKSNDGAMGLPAGRWYYETGRYNALVGSYTPNGNGIFLHNKGNGNYCDDSCAWYGCDGKTYINPGAAEADVATNTEIYNTIVAKCSAQATCTSTTAEFTISINYKKKGDSASTNVTKIEYPYSSSNPSNTTGDKLTSHGSSSITNTSTNANSTILSYGGCYDAADQKRWYMTEWSFPGTWINNKTGEISYVNKPGQGWHEETDKFCMPLDAADANTKWWKKTILNDTTITDAEINSELNTNKSTSANGYNILATARKFGYFSWNFDIKCFYAIYSGTSCTEEDCPPSGVDNYTIRTVDTTEVFPESSSTKQRSTAEVQNRTREIGWNWTTAATNVKNVAYKVEPALLLTNIQNNGDKIYSNDESVDYSFHLNRTALQSIRKYNSKYQYTDWNGSVASVQGNNKSKVGIDYYESNLFRSTGTGKVITTDGAIIKLGTPGKNND